MKWSNNLYWGVLEGDTVANITKTYFNPFKGGIQYLNLPPLVNWKDELVPTINLPSVNFEFIGRESTIIGPIGKMRRDTMIVYVRNNHEVNILAEGSSFFSSTSE